MGDPTRMPAVYLGHGAPPLVDDQLWVSQLQGWAKQMPKPKQILVVSAHWESAPLTVGATDGKTPLTYDFYGFPQRFYEMTYWSPGAPALAANVKAITNGRYENILAALRRGDSAVTTAQAIANSPWGTGGLVLRVLQQG